MYDTSKWELIETGDFMYSLTPSVSGSMYPDATFPNVSTWVALEGRGPRQGKRLLVLNTHLDPYSASARETSAKQLVATAEELRTRFSCPAVLTGDFNSSFAEAPYTALTAARWKDAYSTLHGNYKPGSYTYHKYRGLEYVPEGVDQSDPDAPVDFVWWVGSGQVKSCVVDKSRYDDNGPSVTGWWPSDHYPVVADFDFET
mmetsp:Transcript_41169/g.98771  ORF Transcript_41169/g.98771 Transcript_41169/m.98771 type:complete len:201 (+) Transcript_41169:316-918(+)